MILIAGFLDVLSRGLVFVGLALSIGGTVFRYAVLGAHGPGTRRALSLIAVGAFGAAAFQLLSLVSTAWGLADETGNWPWPAFLETRFAQAELLRTVLCLALGAIALQ